MNANPRGLGKGLSALLSETYTQAPVNVPVEATISGINSLSIDVLKASRFQPRTSFREEPLQELSDSIKRNGIMQPILVRKTGGNAYEIIAGERRWRAAKMAGLATVPVIVREMNDQQALELAIVENIQRQDLSPLDEASGYQRLIDEFGYTQEELAATVGKSRSHVSNLLRLLGLPDDIRQLLEGEKLTVGHARALLGATNPQALAQEIIKRGLNVRQAENLAKGNVMIGSGAGERAPRSQTMPYSKNEDVMALEETLSENLGLTVRINDRGQKGDIVISYTTLSELDNILKRLGGSA